MSRTVRSAYASRTFFWIRVPEWTFHAVQESQVAKATAEPYRVLCGGGFFLLVDQEEVAQFETLRGIMRQSGFVPESEKALLPVYDHGRVSQAIMVLYTK